MMVLKRVIMGSRGRRGRDATLVVVVVEAFILKNLKTEVAHPNHAVLTESGRRDNVGSTSGTENLATDTTMMFPTPSSKYTLTVITFLAVLIVHPIIAG